MKRNKGKRKKEEMKFISTIKYFSILNRGINLQLCFILTIKMERISGFQNDNDSEKETKEYNNHCKYRIKKTQNESLLSRA